MANYVYNVVYRGKERGAAPYMEPRNFPGSPQEFARDELLAWMADHSENENWLVVVNVTLISGAATTPAISASGSVLAAETASPGSRSARNIHAVIPWNII